MTRYNHAYTLAFEVVSQHPDGCTEEEFLSALRARVARLETDPAELSAVCGDEMPFDTYAIGEDGKPL